MIGSVLFEEPVERYVVLLENGATPSESDRSLLESGWSAHDRIALASIGERQSFALLGEPGIGKSTAIRHLIPPDDGTVRVELNEITTATDLEARLRPTAEGSSPLSTIVLDGLDECPLSVKAVSRIVVQRVQANPELRVVVGCRAADWYEPLASGLRAVLGRFDVLMLSPLTAADIEKLAEARGFDGSSFVQSVHDSGAESLAALPLTLDLLLRVFDPTQGLPSEPRKLFEDGLRTLAAEHDPGRLDTSSSIGTGPERYLVATRVAASLTLCGAGTITTAAAASRGKSIDINDLIGGSEPMASGDLSITGNLVTSALATAIFTGSGARGVFSLRHASHGAFLTAQYLHLHRTPEHQLRSLLTRTSALGRTSVPTHLREIAAWMVAMDPSRYGWLVTTDPEATIAHARLVTNPQARALMVSYLLDTPSATRYSSRSQWRLQHSGLADQLRPAFAAPMAHDTGPHLGHPVARRAHTALQVARASEVVEAVPDIRALVEHKGLNPVLRASAAHALADLDDDVARESLWKVLREVRLHPEADPSDDLRGIALDLCWPKKIDAAELLKSIERPSREDYFGSYAMFLTRLVERCSDDELFEIVDALVDRRATATAGRSSSGAVPLFGEAAYGRRLRTVAKELLARALESDRLAEHLAGVGWLFANVAVGSHDRIFLPASLLTDETADVRRRLAVEASKALETDHVGVLAWQCRLPQDVTCWGRGGLLNARDLAWLFQQADDNSPLRAQAFALIRSVFDPNDPSQQQIAWEHRQHPAFDQTVGWWFDPVLLDSDDAERARDLARLDVGDEPSWEGSAKHSAEIESAWNRCRAGDPTAFLDLCLSLWTDPRTGQLEYRSGAPDSWPSGTVCPFEQSTFDTAARAFLAATDPANEEWVRTLSRFSWTGLVGYAAIREGARSAGAKEFLGSLKNPVLASWTAVVLRCPYRYLTDPQTLHDEIVSNFWLRVPHVVAAIYLHWASLTVDTGALLPDTEGVNLAAMVPHIADLLSLSRSALQRLDDLASTDNLHESENARQEAESVARHNLQVLIKLTGDVAEVSKQAIDLFPSAQGHLKSTSARAAAVLGNLQTDSSETRWSDVFADMRADHLYATAIGMELGRSAAQPRWARLLDQQLFDLASWLITNWGTAPVRFDSAPADQPMENWRDDVIRELARRPSEGALRSLAELRDRHTSLEDLSRLVDEAEARQIDESWVGPSPSELATLMRDSVSTFVSDADDLYRVMMLSLDSLSERLQDLGQLLWNEIPEQAGSKTKTAIWRPKYESAISKFVADHLKTKLVGRVVVNREVQVRETTSKGHGLAVDVLAGLPQGTNEVVVPIEIKGNWNRGLMDDLEGQLVKDYLPSLNTKRGIYLCAWFETLGWDDSDSRRRDADRHVKSEVVLALEAQADQLRRDGLQIGVVVVDVPRPTPSLRSL